MKEEVANVTHVSEGSVNGSLQTVHTCEPLENLHDPQGSGDSNWMMALLAPAHPSLPPPLHSDKDSVGSQIGIKGTARAFS